MRQSLVRIRGLSRFTAENREVDLPVIVQFFFVSAFSRLFRLSLRLWPKGDKQSNSKNEHGCRSTAGFQTADDVTHRQSGHHRHCREALRDSADDRQRLPACILLIFGQAVRKFARMAKRRAVDAAGSHVKQVDQRQP